MPSGYTARSKEGTRAEGGGRKAEAARCVCVLHRDGNARALAAGEARSEPLRVGAAETRESRTRSVRCVVREVCGRAGWQDVLESDGGRRWGHLNHVQLGRGVADGTSWSGRRRVSTRLVRRARGGIGQTHREGTCGSSARPCPLALSTRPSVSALVASVDCAGAGWNTPCRQPPHDSSSQSVSRHCACGRRRSQRSAGCEAMAGGEQPTDLVAVVRVEHAARRQPRRADALVLRLGQALHRVLLALGQARRGGRCRVGVDVVYVEAAVGRRQDRRL